MKPVATVTGRRGKAHLTLDPVPLLGTSNVSTLCGHFLQDVRVVLDGHVRDTCERCSHVRARSIALGPEVAR